MIPLHEPRFDETDEKYVLEALRTSWVSTGGPFIDEFEKKIAEYVGTKHAVSVSNGTVGLQLCLEVLKRKLEIANTFEVIVPNLSFIASANAIIHAGGVPVLIDTERNSLNIDVNLVSEAIEKEYQRSDIDGFYRSKATGRVLLAICPVHLMGWTCDMAKVKKLSNNTGIPIIEDSAESLGAFYHNGSHVGQTGLASVFSFNGNKILSTGGGGMVVTNDDYFAKKLKHISTTAKSDNLRFEHDEIGYNFRMVNILAGIGLSQLDKMPSRLKRKKEIFELYKEEVSKFSCGKIHQEENNCSNHWLINIIFQNNNEKERVLNALLMGGIGARPLWTPFHKQPALQDKCFLWSTYDQSEAMWERTLSLPSSPHLTNEQIMNIVKIIKEQF